ncbi:ABC transporter permease [Nocardioides halotolerans]|uniref:ABC transporter permease n=1 Tax=Nocardioides halotolerans TaxID=433660 RepID=UPI0003F76881|nr:ABC transporter permease subunit [Nocardioides halotolerans]
MTTLATRPEPGAPAPVEAESRGSVAARRWAWTAVIVAVWVVVWKVTEGTRTLALPGREHTDLHQQLTEFRDSVLASRDTNPIVQATYQIGEWFVSVFDWLTRMISIPDFPRPVPQIGWLGVLAAAVWTGYAVASWRIAVLVGAAFAAFGIFGYWSDSMDLLIITFVAVAVATLIGLPLAVYYGTGGRVGVGIITTILDLMQTMPTFVYLGPIVLFFGIGASAAVVCTLIYALPPIVRIAGHGIRSVSPTTIEATDSSGQTARQRLTKVQLPMARATIVVGLNQTIMAALSMATLAAYVDGPGLGKPVLRALVKNDVGGAFVPGLLIVLMAIMLDRSTTAASERAAKAARGGADPRIRRIVLAVGLVAVGVCIYLSRTYTWAARFPETEVGPKSADQVDRFFEWFTGTFDGVTGGLKDFVTSVLLNPLQSLLAESPWFVTAAGLCALAFVLGRGRALVAAVVCLAGIWYFDLWHDAMITLNMVLVATLMVMVLAIVFGVWMARRRAVDLALRPLLDAGQTIPPFVYLIPVLALFGPTRFTAIIAGVVYAAPVAIKLVADGIQGVSPATLEASRSTGCTTWQEITKVQLPMARSSLVLATNQGLLYVLSMVVIGGLVGAGALGYDAVLGFSRSEEWGKGAAAGITIVLLGVMIDRICRAAAAQDTTGGADRGLGSRTRALLRSRAPLGPAGGA